MGSFPASHPIYRIFCQGSKIFQLNTLFSGFLSKTGNIQAKHPTIVSFALNKKVPGKTTYFQDFFQNGIYLS